MSDYSVLRAVTETIGGLLGDRITNSVDPALNGVPIDVRTPREMRASGSFGVSLWLYRVGRDADLLNAPPVRPSLDRMVQRALPLQLNYLLTPLAADPLDEQLLMGRVLQTLSDRTILRGSTLRGVLAGSDTELRLILETLTLEELTRVWYALQESYQLSAAYSVQVVSIDSDEEAALTRPVHLHDTRYLEIVG
jgi:Pvc16 N-terminal domain